MEGINTMMIIACVGCKKDIEFNHPRRRLCEDCKKQRITNRWKIFNEKNKTHRELKERTCSVCGNTYYSKGMQSVTCAAYDCKNHFYGLKTKIERAEIFIKTKQENIKLWTKEYERMLEYRK